MQLKLLVKSKVNRDIARKPTENCISEFIRIHNHNLAMLLYGTIITAGETAAQGQSSVKFNNENPHYWEIVV